MFDSTMFKPADTDLLRKVIEEIVHTAPQIDPTEIMVVGAFCRDILHAAQGHTQPLRATNDIDIALALPDWDAFTDLTDHLPRLKGNGNGIRYQVADAPIDLMPFGEDIEKPQGSVTPPPRDEPFSVWAFAEVFEAALPLPLAEGLAVRVPTVPGYTALKLCAWLDRSVTNEVKDAPDLATTLFWYAESETVSERLYTSDAAVQLLVDANMDLGLASGRLLGLDVADLLGPDRRNELAARWPGTQRNVLIREFIPALGQTPTLERREELLNSLEHGLFGIPPG